jgi:hypothetical protein
MWTSATRRPGWATNSKAPLDRAGAPFQTCQGVDGEKVSPPLVTTAGGSGSAETNRDGDKQATSIFDRPLLANISVHEHLP